MKVVCLERIKVAGLEELREPRELRARSRHLAVVAVVVEQRVVEQRVAECMRVVVLPLPAGRPAVVAVGIPPLQLRSKELRFRERYSTADSSAVVFCGVKCRWR